MGTSVHEARALKDRDDLLGAIAESGATGPQAMGKAMAVLKPRIAGRADMGKASALVKQRLS